MIRQLPRALRCASSSSSSLRRFHSSAVSLNKKPAASASSSTATPSPSTPPPQRGNTASDIRRIFKEQQRQAEEAELFPWEKVQTKITAWEPKYEDERQFYYASKTQEGQQNIDGAALKRYYSKYGSRYLLSKLSLASPADLPSIDMTRFGSFNVELQIGNGPLNYWYLNMQTKQQPNHILPIPRPGRRTQKVTQTLRLRLSQDNMYEYLRHLHELWPRKDERDIAWAKQPSREHGIYRLRLDRVLAEGPTKPLNTITHSFIDFLSYQISFHFKEAAQQNRNINWLQFMGVPGVKVLKKWGGEIKVPTLRRDEIV